MGASAFSGPVWSTGLMDYLAATFGLAVPDYNADASPSIFYQGTGEMDVRFLFEKNKLNGFTGVQPAFRHLLQIESVNCVPSAFGAAKVVAAAHTTSGTAMTLVNANSAGISKNVPFVQWNQSGTANATTTSRAGSSVVTVPTMLDFGFGFGTTTSGSKTVVVSDSTLFSVGMPIVLAGAGSTATSCLLTWVTGITDATHITINDAPGQSATPAIGHGNVWPGAPLQQPVYPTAHAPYIPGGPGLFLNGGEALARGLSVTCNSASGTGGNFVVTGWDVYGQIMHETIVSAPGTALVTYGLKAFKGISSVVPNFTDSTYTYSVGTSDTFGFNLRSDRWELTEAAWAGSSVTSNAGWAGWVAAASGDVRGTFQASAHGAGTGYGTTNSTGSVSNLVMTGNRLFLSQALGLSSALNGTPLAPQTVFGPVQT